MLYNEGRFSFQPFIQCRARKCDKSRTFFQYDSLWRDAIHHEFFPGAHHLNDGSDGYVLNWFHAFNIHYHLLFLTTTKSPPLFQGGAVVVCYLKHLLLRTLVVITPHLLSYL